MRAAVMLSSLTAMASCTCGYGCGGETSRSAETTRPAPGEGPAAATPRSEAERRAGDPATPAPDFLRAALDHPDRPAEDRARDGDRKPDQVLQFFAIEPGARVAEMMAGRGYYVEILARAVGPKGAVYAHNNRYVLDRFAAGPLAKRLAHPDLAHVVRLDRELDDPGLPAGELDAVLMILFYHDAFWMKADRARMNRAIFDALRPGGTYGIVDHHGEAGSGARDVKTLHRIDVELVKQEILAAGFELVGESDVLRRPEDDRTGNVFAPELRGKTDRFVLRFRRP